MRGLDQSAEPCPSHDSRLHSLARRGETSWGCRTPPLLIPLDTFSEQTVNCTAPGRVDVKSTCGSEAPGLPAPLASGNCLTFHKAESLLAVC